MLTNPKTGNEVELVVLHHQNKPATTAELVVGTLITFGTLGFMFWVMKKTFDSLDASARKQQVNTKPKAVQ